MGGKNSNTIFSGKFTTDALPKLLYSKEVFTKAAQRIVIPVCQILDYMLFFSLTEGRMKVKVQATSPLKLNSKFTPIPSKKCTLLGRVSAKVNSIVNFQTQWEIIR